MTKKPVPYVEFKQMMAQYEAIEASDPIARMAQAGTRSAYRIIIDIVGITVMLSNFFDPRGDDRPHQPLWAALAAVFLVLLVFDIVKASRLFEAKTALAGELWRLKQEGAADPLDMFNLLGGFEGWKQRLDGQAAEEAAMKRAQDR